MRDCYRVRCGQLRNGLRFYSQYDNGDTRELAVVGIMTGSFHDPANKRGLAHLVEHEIQSSTYNHERSRLLNDRIVDFRANFAYTNRMFTTFGPPGSLRRNHNRRLFQIYAEAVSNPLLTKEIHESAKATIHQEHFSEGRDIPNDHVMELLEEILFPKSFPVRNPIDGRMGELRRITLNDVRRHIRRYCVPKNTFVIFQGPTYWESKALIEEKLGDWGINWSDSRNQGAKFTFRNGKGGFRPLPHPKIRDLMIPGIHQYHVAIGFPTDTYWSVDAEALDVLANVLSEKMFRRLRLENTNWHQGTYSAPVIADQSFAHGFLAFQFATLDEGFARHGIRIFREECREICEKLIDRDELEACIGYICEYKIREPFQKSPIDLIDLVINAVANGDLDLEWLHNREERFKKLLKRGGRQKIREAANRCLSGHSARVVIHPAK